MPSCARKRANSAAAPTGRKHAPPRKRTPSPQSRPSRRRAVPGPGASWCAPVFRRGRAVWKILGAKVAALPMFSNLCSNVCMGTTSQGPGLPQQFDQISADKYQPVESAYLDTDSPAPIGLTWEERGGAGNPSRWLPSQFLCLPGGDTRRSARTSTATLLHGLAVLSTLNGRAGECIALGYGHLRSTGCNARSGAADWSQLLHFHDRTGLDLIMPTMAARLARHSWKRNLRTDVLSRLSRIRDKKTRLPPNE